MCGIAGIVSSKGIDISKLGDMSKCLSHRGPDDEGYFLLTHAGETIHCKGDATIQEKANLRHLNTVREPVRIGLSHRRLSILDLSAAGHQPMTFGNDLTIVFNGEIYNYRELRDELSGKGHGFVSKSDTEVILAAYGEWGASCVEKFRGMWAFALYDKRRHSLFLSRDRFGIKPLYYVSEEHVIAFASEIKALLTLSHGAPKLRQRAFLEYVTFGTTADASGILFEGIQAIAPGNNMFIDVATDTTSYSEYYQLRKPTVRVPSSDNTAVNTFSGHLNESIDLHLRSDVPVGVCLSGGLDSSYIASYLAKSLNPAPVSTFTAAYRDQMIDESCYAAKVRQRHQNISQHMTYPEINTFWEEVDQQIYYHDLPFHSTSMFAQWEVFKLAKTQGIKVILNGQGSDELLGGYYNNAGMFLIDLLRGMRLHRFIHEYRKLQVNLTRHINQDIARAAYAFFPASLKRFARRKMRLGINYLAQDYQQEIQKLLPPANTGADYAALCISMVYFGLQQLLRYEDRISMAFSIESRVPFLDHLFAEYCIALDSSWKFRDGWSKYILRTASESLVPEEVVWRKDKMGFLTPAAQWRKGLIKQLEEYALGYNFPAVFDRNAVLGILTKEFTRPADLSAFWNLIILMKWFDVYKVKV